MFLPKNLNLNNKYFFVNFLRYVFSHYDYIIFFHILKHSNSFFSSFRMLRFTSSLNIFMLNSKIVNSVIRKTINNDLFPATNLILYTNNLNDIIYFFKNNKGIASNFLPFALLFKKYFISLDAIIIEQFISWEKKANSFFIFFILFYFNFVVLRYFFSVFSSLFLLGNFNYK